MLACKTADRQTDRQTDTGTGENNLFGGGDNCNRHSVTMRMYNSTAIYVRTITSAA